MRGFGIAGVIAALATIVASVTVAVPASAAVVSVANADQLCAGIENATGSQTLNLTADIQISTGTIIACPSGSKTGYLSEIPNGADVTINLNGFILDITASGHYAALRVYPGASLTIADPQLNGQLYVVGGDDSSAIGGDDQGNPSAGSITIAGGNVDATAGPGGGAAIGGGTSGSASSITISGGSVIASGSSSGPGGPGIGSGTSTSTVGVISISGGTVVATGTGTGAAGIGGASGVAGGSISISGGDVTAQGGTNGAGIGTGGGSSGTTLTVNISGGTINATGGNRGAGIGSGFQTDFDDITISDGVITATGGNGGAGIGSGRGGDGNSITITGGDITVEGPDGGAGIGGGTNSGFVTTISISDAAIDVLAEDEGAGIGGGSGADGATTTITDSTLTVEVAAGGSGIGGGDSGAGGSLTIVDSTVAISIRGGGAGIGGGLGGDGGTISITGCSGVSVTSPGSSFQGGGAAIGSGAGALQAGTLSIVGRAAPQTATSAGAGAAGNTTGGVAAPISYTGSGRAVLVEAFDGASAGESGTYGMECGWLASFNAAGGTGSMTDEFGASSVVAPSNGFTNTGFTFGGWTTSSSGQGGTTYQVGATIPLSADLALYAIWTSNSSNAPSLTLTPNFVVGDLAPGAQVSLSGGSLQPTSQWSAIVRSSPVTIASGLTDSSGNFSQLSNLPQNIDPGQHTITLYGTTPSGAQWTRVLYITVGENLRVTYMSAQGPQGSGLASTGVPQSSVFGAWFAGIALLLGAALLMLRRRLG